MNSATLDWLKPVSQQAVMNEAGRVFVIRCMPDVFTAEILNVGVCGISASGQRLVKVMTEPGRLACLYGDSAINVVLLAQAAAEAARTGARSPSPQIIFDEPTPYYNTTLNDQVDNTFADQVTAALPQRQAADTEQLTDEVARQRTIDAIKLARGLETDFIANTPLVILSTDSGPRPIYIPLQPARAVGTIRSASYSPESLKMHLLESVLDMEAAQRYKQKPAAGLFILRPASKEKKLNAAIDKTIDAIAWRCHKSLQLEVEPTPEKLALVVTQWADAYA